MFRARRETWAAFAALIFAGCGGGRAPLAPIAPVAPRPTASVPAVPTKDVVAKDAAPKDAPPASTVRPKSEDPEVETPLPLALRSAFEKKRLAREALAAVLERGGEVDGKAPPELQPALEAMLRCHGLVFSHAKTLGSDDRKTLLAPIVREIEDDHAFYEAHDLDGIALRVTYELGRAHALAGDVDRACREGFDPIITYSEADLDAAATRWIEELKLYAYYMKAKTQFDAGRYDGVVETVDRLFGDLPKSLDTDQGNGALLLKAEALMLMDPPDLECAIREATRVIERANGFWPNNANQLLAKIVDMQTFPDADAVMSPRAHLQAAHGATQLATKAGDPAEKRRLMGRAVDAYRRAISACAGKGIALRERLEVESSAWFELGIVYSKLELWYESSFAFEAVMARFSKACVGRMLAKDLWLRRPLAEARRRIASGEVVADGGEDPPDENELLHDEAAKMPEWSGVLKKIDERLRKSANNYFVSLRRRHNESRSDFDDKRMTDFLHLHPDPAKVRDLDFHRGLFARAEAEGRAKAGKTAAAAERWQEAAKLFLDTARTNEHRRALSLHLAGKCLLEAMKATLAVAAKEPGLKAEAKRLGHEAYRAFEAFLKEPAGPEPEFDLERGTEAVVRHRARRARQLRVVAEAKAEIEKTFGAPPTK